MLEAAAVVRNISFGTAVPAPGRLVQPFAVWVTEKLPAVFTVIDGVVAPVFHTNIPAAAVDNVDVPSQLFSTVTTGAGGVAGCGLIAMLVGGDIQPSIVFIVKL